MDAKKISILSMIAASSCCLPPLILLGLTLIGVGTAGFAGFSSTLGSLKWYILPLSIVGVGFSYWFYFKEKKKCSSSSCKMVNQKFTLTMLILSTIVVTGFLSWSIYPYILGYTPLEKMSTTTSSNFAEYRVEGMTCGGCEIAIDEAIKATGHVDSVKSSFVEGKTIVWFKEKHEFESISEAVASVGYKLKPIKLESEK